MNFLSTLYRSWPRLLSCQMINFGSAADKSTLQTSELTCRYTGPPIDSSKYRSSGSDGTRTPGSMSRDSERPRSSRRRKSRPLSQMRRRPPPSRDTSQGSTSADIVRRFNTNWDLVSRPAESFPNWESFSSIADTFRHTSKRYLKYLTRPEILESSRVVPSPHDLVVLNILRNKLKSWRTAEEDLSEVNGLVLQGNKYADESAYTSWALTQNRDFGSAVWRLMRLSPWGEVQSPSMKGL